MKPFVKILKISLSVFFVTIVSLLVAGWLLQDRIIRFAMEEMGTTFGAPLEAEKVSFSLISDFPEANLKFDNIWLGRHQYDEYDEILDTDTLAKFQKLSVSLNTRALLNDEIIIKNIAFSDGFVLYAIDSTGKMTYDYLIPVDTTDTADQEESTPLYLTVDEISLTNFRCMYSDDQLKAKANVFIQELNANLKMDDDNLTANAIGKIELSKLKFEDTKADRVDKIDLNFDITYASDTIYTKLFALDAGDLTLNAKGKIIAGEQTYTDLTLDVFSPSLAALTKYAPEGMLKEYGISQVAGQLNFNTQLKGIIGDELPFYNATVDLSKASIKYQDFPLIYNLNLNTDATNGKQKNNRTTAINLKKLEADCSGNHLDLSGQFSNLDRLNYDFSSNLDIDLYASRTLIPDSVVRYTEGLVNIQLSTKGILTDSLDSAFIATALEQTKLEINLNKLKFNIPDGTKVRQLSGDFSYANRQLDASKIYVYLPNDKVRLSKNSFTAQFEGDFMQPENTRINIPNFYFATDEGSISGSATLNKLKHLRFDVSSKLNLELAKLMRFAPDTLVNDMSGSIQAYIKSKGKLNIDKMNDEDLESIMYDNSDFELNFDQVNLNMKDTLMSVYNLNGKIAKKQHTLSINDLKGVYQNLAFNVEHTTVKNAFNTAIRNQPGTLKVDGIYRFGDLDYKVLAAFASEDEESSPSTEQEPEPTNWNYEITGQAFVKSFKYDDTFVKDIEADYDINDAKQLIKSNIKIGQTLYGQTATVNNLSTKLEMNMSTNEVKGKLAIEDMKYEDALLTDISALYNANDTVYTVDQMKFKGFGGETNSSLKVHMKPDDEMEVEMKSNIMELDVRRLMKEMKDFDQTEMTYEQLNGIVSSDNLFLKFKMIGDSIDYADMMMTCDLKFHDGGIYHYPPVQDMAQYLKKLDNLDTLSFKTIETHMFLFKEAMYVPRTYVVTSIFDVDVIGMQSFGEDYRYHVGINLGQVLGKKEASSIDDNVKTDKKKMVRVQATGNKGDYKSGIDNKKDREKMKTIVFNKQRAHNLVFHPKWFNFETGVEKE
ncbi:MAG: hypothetical protein ABJH98_06805 [Reichenbachiella sp.]|uniref:hypothetical protein n=1 Tax=Reichenbachiella sp. TaxID=2184521 RepID=UPI00329A10A7